MSTLSSKRVARIALTAGAAVAAVAMLAACGESTGTDPASSSASASPSESMLGGDPATWSPLEVTLEQNGDTFPAVPNQVGLFIDLPESKTGYTVVSSDEAIVRPMSSADETTAAGWQAVALGSADVTVYDKNPDENTDAQPIITITVSVIDPAQSSAEPTSAPAMN